MDFILSIACQRLSALDWKAALADVRPFLEHPDEAELLTPETFTRLLRQ